MAGHHVWMDMWMDMFVHVVGHAKIWMVCTAAAEGQSAEGQEYVGAIFTRNLAPNRPRSPTGS